MHTEKTLDSMLGRGVIRNRCYERSCKTPAHRAGLCRFHYEQQQARETETIKVAIEKGGQPLSKRRCHVYAVLAENGLIKIGSALHPESRVTNLQGQSPVRVKLTLLGAIIGNRELERTIHRRLDKHREHGEWFRNEGEVKHVVEAIVARDAVRLMDLIRLRDEDFAPI